MAQSAIAYDEDLANRIREIVGTETGLSEQKMFGGLAFLISGDMSVAASRKGAALAGGLGADRHVGRPLPRAPVRNEGEADGRLAPGGRREDSDDA